MFQIARDRASGKTAARQISNCSRNHNATHNPIYSYCTQACLEMLGNSVEVVPVRKSLVASATVTHQAKRLPHFLEQASSNSTATLFVYNL